MLAAVAAQIAGNVAGRAEILAEADRHVVVDPTFDFLCPGPWIALTPYRDAALALHFRVVAVDEMATLEIHVFRFAWPGHFGRTTAGAHMKFKCVACDVRRGLAFVAYEGRGSVVVSLYGNPVNRRARFVWTGDSLIQRDAGAYQNVSCPGACDQVQKRSARAGRVADHEGEPPDGPRRGQSHLDAPVRPGTGPVG